MVVCIAGPQASGKSAAVRFLGEVLPGVKIHEEVGAKVISEKGLKGGFDVTENVEREILEREIALLEEVLRNREGVHVLETSVFSLAHARAQGFPNLVLEFLPKFLNLISQLPFKVVFLDAKPAASWRRRESVYKKRGLSAEELFECKDRILRMYDELANVYLELSCEKIKIDNNSEDLKTFQELLLKKCLNFGIISGKK